MDGTLDFRPHPTMHTQSFLRWPELPGPGLCVRWSHWPLGMWGRLKPSEYSRLPSQCSALYSAPCLPVYHLQTQAWLWLEELDGQCSIRKHPLKVNSSRRGGRTTSTGTVARARPPANVVLRVEVQNPQEIHAGRGNIHVLTGPQSGTSWVSRCF